MWPRPKYGFLPRAWYGEGLPRERNPRLIGGWEIN